MIDRKSNPGFTLIELLITVSILLILVAIAVPNYRGHVLRSQRSDAMAALLRVAAEQEKFYMQNNTYSATLAGLNVDSASANGHYGLALANVNAQGFDVTATPTGGQTSDEKCLYFRYDEQGTKFASDDGAGAGADTTTLCWR